MRGLVGMRPWEAVSTLVGSRTWKPFWARSCRASAASTSATVRLASGSASVDAAARVLSASLGLLGGRTAMRCTLGGGGATAVVAQPTSQARITAAVTLDLTDFIDGRDITPLP